MLDVRVDLRAARFKVATLPAVLLAWILHFVVRYHIFHGHRVQLLFTV